MKLILSSFVFAMITGAAGAQAPILVKPALGLMGNITPKPVQGYGATVNRTGPQVNGYGNKITGYTTTPVDPAVKR